jgi:aminoglycoside phosphotransferase (APT) family kinase protein
MNLEADQPGPVRAGEELPADRLEPYLRQQFPEATGPFLVEQFPQGHSNLTYFLRLGDQELVLRRPPFGNQVKTAHDMGREYRILSKLSMVFPAAPKPYFYCDDEGILGAPFYVMERRRGVILRKQLPPGVVIDPDTARRLSIALIDNLAALHALDYRAAGLGDFGKPEGFVARQVTGWSNRYAAAKTEERPAMERLAGWLATNLPPDSGAAVIHNDYKYDNLVLDAGEPTCIRAVLDWEMATIGDPLLDLGTTLGYWAEAADPEPLQRAAFGPTTLPGSLNRRQLVERYQEKSGRPAASMLFYYCFGLFKVAVIVQQIYARYVRGHTRDPRFARLNDLVAVLSDQADRTLEEGRV